MDLIKPFFHKIDCNDKGVIDFFSFLEGIYIVSNGTLREKLLFYFQLHENGHNGLFDKGDYYKILDAIARFVPSMSYIYSTYIIIINTTMIHHDYLKVILLYIIRYIYEYTQ
jgi:hypothetical protein